MSEEILEGAGNPEVQEVAPEVVVATPIEVGEAVAPEVIAEPIPEEPVV